MSLRNIGHVDSDDDRNYCIMDRGTPKAGSNTRQPTHSIGPRVTRDMDHRRSLEDLENGKEFIDRNGFKLHQGVYVRDSGGDSPRTQFEKSRTCKGNNCDEFLKCNCSTKKNE